MMKSESLCLPFCGKNLTLAYPNEEPGYDAFEKIVGEPFLTKLNNFINKTVGTKVYTQLDTEKDQNMNDKELEGQKRPNGSPLYEKYQDYVIPKDEEKQNIFGYLREAMEDRNNYTNIIHPHELLPENQTNTLGEQQREIEALSKNLIIETSQIANIEAPFYGSDRVSISHKKNKRTANDKEKTGKTKRRKYRKRSDENLEKAESPGETNENKSNRSSPGEMVSGEIPVLLKDKTGPKTVTMTMPRINFSLTEFLDIRSPNKKRHQPTNNNKHYAVVAQLPSFSNANIKNDENSNDSNTSGVSSKDTVNSIEPESTTDDCTNGTIKNEPETDISRNLDQIQDCNEGENKDCSTRADTETDQETNAQNLQGNTASLSTNECSQVGENNNVMNATDYFSNELQINQYNNFVQDMSQMYTLMSGLQCPQDFVNAYNINSLPCNAYPPMQTFPEFGTNFNSQYTPFQTIATPMIQQEIDQAAAELENMSTNAHELLGTTDISSDLFSNTLLKDCPQKRKYSKKSDQSGTSLEDVAAACLPDAFDLWKDKYRALVIEEYPVATRKEVDDRLTEIWCRLPDMHRRRYFQKAEKLARRYNSTAAFSYMNRFKNKHPTKKYNEPNVPSKMYCPTPVHTSTGALDIVIKDENENESRKSSESDENSNDSSNSNDYDYKGALKETQTYNSPVKKALTKKLNKRQKQQQQQDNSATTVTATPGIDVTDESMFATGVLIDIMMTDGDSSQQNQDEEATPQLKPSSWSPTEMMSELTTLDISALDEYLTGTDSSFIEESSSVTTPSKRKRRRTKRKEGKDKKSKAKKTNN